MCEFCTKHGEGKEWYLRAKHYGADLLSDIRRRQHIKDFFFWTDRVYKKHFRFVTRLPLGMPLIGPALRAVVKRTFIYRHWGQVVPIELVREILALTNSIVRIPCVCRNIISGKIQRTCFVTSLSPDALGVAELLDQSFFGGPDIAKFEKISKEEAFLFMEEQEKKGLFHSIWTFDTPFIGGICNCDKSGCIGTKLCNAKAPIIFPSEFIALVDKNTCTGCKACIEVCQFNAIKYDTTNKKAEIDKKMCYGCGVCRKACKFDAISLEERKTMSLR